MVERPVGQRPVRTVLFTDLVDSTRKALQMGDAAWRLLLARHDEAIRTALDAFAGTEEKTTGDGFLATFDAPADAIRCAAKIRESVRALGLEARCGLHTGEIEVERHDVGGIAVHTAARVVDCAQAGEILVTRTVRDLVAGSGIQFGRGRRCSLHGLPGRWLLFPIASVPAGAGASPRARAWRRPRVGGRAATVAAAATALVLALALGPRIADSCAPPPSTRTLAVLPFDVHGPDSLHLREGLVDLLFRNLDGVAGIRLVHPRTVLRRWAERDSVPGPADLEESLAVAGRAEASLALVGSVTPIGRGIRLAAQIYEVSSPGSTVLSARPVVAAYAEGPPDSLPALVDRLSVEVLRGILADAGTDVPSPSIERITTSSVPALTAFLEGERFLRRSEVEAAAAAYRRAIAHDSTFAFAWGRLAQAYGWSGGLGAAASHEAAEHALRLAHRLPERDARILRGGVGFLRGDLRSIPVLSRATETYPDDAEAWFLLGDALYHLGPQAGRPEEEALPPLRRAVALDPTFAPAYVHLIQIAFHGADSAAAVRLMAGRSRTGPANRFVRESRLAYDLAFGTATARDRARGALDTLEVRSLAGVAGYLVHPGFLEEQASVLQALRERGTGAERALGTIGLYHNALARGRLRAALALLDDPFLPPDVAVAALYGLHALGIPLPPGQPDLLLASLPREALGDVGAFVSGARAVELGRDGDRDAAAAELDAASAGALAAGDSSAARFLAGAAEALEGYAAWTRGDLQHARARLDSARRAATGHGARATVNATIRLWASEVRVAAGRPREAEADFALRDTGSLVGPFWQGPLLALHRAHLLERLGDRAAAGREYAFFLDAWRDSDPQLEAVVAEARSAASRLSSRPAQPAARRGA
jgi:class 3 adenylate cyclase